LFEAVELGNFQKFQKSKSFSGTPRRAVQQKFSFLEVLESRTNREIFCSFSLEKKFWVFKVANLSNK
jgi:hypothetical protein